MIDTARTQTLASQAAPLVNAESERQPWRSSALADRPNTPSAWWLWLILLLVILVPRGFAIVRSVAPARDALRFVRASKTLAEAPFLSAIKQIDTHPLYPLSMVGVHRLGVKLAGHDSADVWFRSAQVWSTVCYCWFISVSFLVGRRIFSAWSAFLGCMVVGVVPRQIFYSVDFLSDNLHAALWMTSFALAQQGWLARQSRWFLLAGVVAGFAYLTRVEALVLPTMVASSLMVALVFRAGWLGWKTWFFGGVGFLVGLLLVMLPYVAHIGKISPRNSASAITGESTTAEPFVTAADRLTTLAQQPIPPAAQPSTLPQPLPPKVTQANDANAEQLTPKPQLATSSSPPQAKVELDAPLITRPYTGMEGYSDKTLQAAFLRIWFELGQETRGWLLMFAGYALLDWSRLRARPGTWIMPTLAFLIYTTLMVVLQIKAGYMAGRYLMPILPFVGMFAVVGMEVMLRRLMILPVIKCRFTSEQVLTFRRRGFYAGCLLAAALLYIPGWLEPMHQRRFGHMAAADWLDQHGIPGESVFDPLEVTAFFANRPVWHPQPGQSAPVHARYAIIDPKLVYRVEDHVHAAIKHVNDVGVVVAKFPMRKGGKEVGVYLFELPSPADQMARVAQVKTAHR